MVEARNHTALFRSDDAGDSWTETNNSFNVSGRPFYFARLAADPKNADRIYKPGFFLTVSEDGWQELQRCILLQRGHLAAEIMAIITRCGLIRKIPTRCCSAPTAASISRLIAPRTGDFSKTFPWRSSTTSAPIWLSPTTSTAVCRITARGWAHRRAPDGIANRHWRNIGSGRWFLGLPRSFRLGLRLRRISGRDDLAFPQVHRRIERHQASASCRRAGVPFQLERSIHLSPNYKGTIYLGGQFLFRSKDHGESWERISPDLTTNDPARQHQELSGGLTIDNSDAEKFETIYTIAESPKNGEVIWVGTDDGNVQVTRDGGKHWTNVAKNISGLPAGTWVSTIEAGHFDPAVAFATFDGHAAGDMKTYVYQTKDYGKTWTSITTPELTGYAHVVRQDLVNANLLFVGTEFGLFISIDGGAHWAQFKGSLPNVAVRDIAIQPRESDLLLATHGRGIFILDDLTPIRALTPEILAKDLVMLPSRPSVLTLPAGEQRFDGDAEFNGRSLPESAGIVYYQKKRHIFGDLKLEIYRSQGPVTDFDPGRQASRIESRAVARARQAAKDASRCRLGGEPIRLLRPAGAGRHLQG